MNICGFYAGLLAVTEVGLGSALHAARIPFRGQLLSLNQIFLLTKASLEHKKNSSRIAPLTISCAAATLKILSPMGTKITPMIAILAQGLCYSLGTVLFGHTILGRLVGAILCSIWALFQHFLVLFIVMSSSAFASPDLLFPIFKSMLAIKVCLAVGVVLAAPYIKTSWFERYVQKTKSFLPKHNRNVSPWRGALRESMRPLFLAIVFLSGAVAFQMTKSWSVTVLALTKPFFIGFSFFFLMRVLPLTKIIQWIQNRKWIRISAALESAFSFFSEESIHAAEKIQP